MRRQPDKANIVPKRHRPAHEPWAAALEQAHFVTTAAQWDQLPEGGAPEVAFAGRSNAGKSSAINALTRRARLAFSSKTPGRTRHINFFRVRSGAMLADLPGYGYAQAPASVRRHWQHFVARYLAQRDCLVGLVLIMDARHSMTALDRQALDWMRPSGLPIHLLLAKSDKLGRAEQRQVLEDVRHTLASDYAEAMISAQLFSATTGQGVEEAREVVASWLDASGRAPQKERPRCQGE